MSYRKRSSRTLNRVRQRSTGLKSINPNIDMGDGLSAKAFTGMVNDLQNMLDAYNTALADADVLKNRLADAEKTLAEYSERILLAVAAKYGKNSDEYERIGGVRTNDRKRPTRQALLTAQPAG